MESYVDLWLQKQNLFQLNKMEASLERVEWLGYKEWKLQMWITCCQKGTESEKWMCSQHLGCVNGHQEFNVILNDIKAILHYVTGPVSNKRTKQKDLSQVKWCY